MIWALLAVKSPDNAMGRLAPVLSPEQRRTLGELLYQEMLDKLLRARGFDGVVVVSSDRGVLDAARRAGASVLEESLQQGHSSSADWAAARLQAEGARAVVTLPIDVPLAAVPEIEQLARACSRGESRSVVIVPSQDGAGTNGLGRTPPGVIKSRFGPGSFAAHAEQARACGARLEVLRPPGLVFDLDTPDDLREFLGRSAGGTIRDFLDRIGAAEAAAGRQEFQPAEASEDGAAGPAGAEPEAAAP